MDSLILVDWMQRLALTSSISAFAQSLESLFCEQYEIEGAEFWQLSSTFKGDFLERPSQTVSRAISELDMIGRVILNCEAGTYEAGGGHTDLIFPVKLYGKVLGAVALHFGPGEASSSPNLDTDLAVLQDFIGLQVGQLRERAGAKFLRRQSDQFVQRALETLQGPEHLTSVAQVVQDLGGLLSLPIQTRRVLQMAALYHDVGFLVSCQGGDWNLRSGPLSEADVQTHAVVGADYLLEFPEFSEVSGLVRYHHERYDGTGPLAKHSNELPIECWVLVLAEDLVEHRERRLADPAKALLGREDWIRSFFDGCGDHHHPAVVDALGGLLVAGRLTL